VIVDGVGNILAHPGGNRVLKSAMASMGLFGHRLPAKHLTILANVLSPWHAPSDLINEVIGQVALAPLMRRNECTFCDGNDGRKFR
jgi:hypothetical protein